MEIARASIAHGIVQGASLLPELSSLPDELRQTRASFVTLLKSGRLRGCIGTLQAHRPLGTDVAENAWSAAFRDPRFPALRDAELAEVSIELSLLTPPAPLSVTSEADLLEKLRPGIDGLILQDANRRATFLPAVWEQLSEPRDFVKHLKIKAGLHPDHWSERMVVQTYTAEKIRE